MYYIHAYVYIYIYICITITIYIYIYRYVYRICSRVESLGQYTRNAEPETVYIPQRGGAVGGGCSGWG